MQDEQKPPVEPAATATKKRPRLDLTDATGDIRDRKRGKSMFGILLGTLNKAKIEDKERNASEAVCIAQCSIRSFVVFIELELYRQRSGI